MSIQNDVKKAIEDVLGPDLAAIKGELKAVNAKLDRMTEKADECAALHTSRRGPKAG